MKLNGMRTQLCKKYLQIFSYGGVRSQNVENIAETEEIGGSPAFLESRGE